MAQKTRHFRKIFLKVLSQFYLQLVLQVSDIYRQLKDGPEALFSAQQFPPLEVNFTLADQAVGQAARLDAVFVPHSHDDPGWLETFEDYYLRVERVLSNALRFLHRQPRMRFVQTEMAFFELWWAEQGAAERDKFKR